MHARREGGFFHFVRREVESARDDPGIMPALLAMSRSVLFPQFGGARQGFDGLLHRLPIRITLASAELAQRADQLFEVLRSVMLALQKSFDIASDKLSVHRRTFTER